MTKAFDCATRLLFRREHGARELADKLEQRGYSAEEALEVIAECQRLGLQSDQRFAESFCRARIQKGCGPVKISQELQAKKLDRSLIRSVLEQEQENWLDYALVVWQKKYKNQDVKTISIAELQKQKQFLLYRGFTTDIIAGVMANLREEQRV